MMAARSMVQPSLTARVVETVAKRQVQVVVPTTSGGLLQHRSGSDHFRQRRSYQLARSVEVGPGGGGLLRRLSTTKPSPGGGKDLGEEQERRLVPPTPHREGTAEGQKSNLSTKATSETTPSTTTAAAFVDRTLRGMGQVVFANSPTSGALVALGLTACDPLLGGMALLGCASATAAATHAMVGIEDGKIADGLAGYNGALVGCAFAVFMGDCSGSAGVTAAAATVLGGAASAVVYDRLGGWGTFADGTPQLTLAFNGVALGTLAAFVRPLSATATTGGADEAAAAAAAAAAPDPVSASSSVGLVDAMLSAPLAGVSQIYVAESAFAGAAILAALAFQGGGVGNGGGAAAAAHALGGSCVGAATSYVALGMPLGDVASGLGGFNPALTALAMHVFCRPAAIVASGGDDDGGVSALRGYGTYGLAVGGAAGASAVVTSAMAPVAAVGLGIPVCTVPFCVTTIGCLTAVGKGWILGVEMRAT